MPKYHFHQRTGHRVVEDDEGSDFPDIETARQYALHAARELLAESIRWNGKPPPRLHCRNGRRRAADYDGASCRGFARKYQGSDSIRCVSTQLGRQPSLESMISAAGALETCPPILRMSVHRRILLQKSFCGLGLKVSEPQARRLKNDVGDHASMRQTHRRFR